MKSFLELLREELKIINEIRDRDSTIELWEHKVKNANEANIGTASLILGRLKCERAECLEKLERARRELRYYIEDLFEK